MVGREGEGHGRVRPDLTNDEATERAASDENEQQPKSYGTILEEEIFQGLHELQRPAFGLFLSGLSAGLDIGFSLFMMGTVLTLLNGVVPPPLLKMLVSTMYSVGFLFVILGRSELFTEHTTLAVFPVLGGRAGVGRLARLWGIIYASNLIGACAFAGLAVWIGPPLGAIEPWAFGEIGRGLVDHPSSVIFAGAILAGWMMGILSWLLAASQETISRIVITVIITSSIGLAGLHHCVVGTVEVLSAVFADQGVGMADFGRFLLWATLGNALGGVFFVGLIKYSHAIQGPAFLGRRPHR